MQANLGSADATMIRVQARPDLDPAARAARDGIVAAAQMRDGVAPLSEAALLALGDANRYLLAWAGSAIVGYGYVPAGAGAAEIVAAPWARGVGVGRELLRAAMRSGATGVWAHGDLAPARALARWSGAQVARDLWVLSRPLAGLPADVPALPADLTVTAYRGTADDTDLLRVNAAAFADLPDQASWTAADLTARMAADWFDPDGLFLARTPSGEVVGFHWTKRRSPDEGEIYVLATDPAWQGRGLGRALIDIGLRHLAAQGLRTVVLYVDGSNTVARAAYAKAGFGPSGQDVLYTWDSQAVIARETIRSG